MRKKSKSYLIIGMGRFGSAIATELCQIKHEVMVVDENEERVAAIAHQVTEALVGDAKDEAVLRALGVNNFDATIVSIANKLKDSILITMMLKEMGAKHLICKAQSELHEKILYKIGADKVIRPEYEMGRQTAHLMEQ